MSLQEVAEILGLSGYHSSAGQLPGVRKYRSVEEAWRARQEWVRSQLRRPADRHDE